MHNCHAYKTGSYMVSRNILHMAKVNVHFFAFTTTPTMRSFVPQLTTCWLICLKVCRHACTKSIECMTCIPSAETILTNFTAKTVLAVSHTNCTIEDTPPRWTVYNNTRSFNCLIEYFFLLVGHDSSSLISPSTSSYQPFFTPWWCQTNRWNLIRFCQRYIYYVKALL